MPEQLALDFLRFGDGRLVSVAPLLLGVIAFIVSVVRGGRKTISRAAYFFFVVLTASVSVVLGTVARHLPAATETGHAWLIVAASLLIAMATGFILGLLSLWRSLDFCNKRWPALLGLVPLVGLFLLFAPPVRGSRDKSSMPAIVGAVLAAIAIWMVATMIAQPGAEPTVRSAAASAASSLIVGNEASELTEVIAYAKAGHLQTCKASIKQQSVIAKEVMRDDQIDRYCRCLGEGYFNDFTHGDVEAMLRSGQLPRRVVERRDAVQESCFGDLLQTAH